MLHLIALLPFLAYAHAQALTSSPKVAAGVDGWFKAESNCVAEPAGGRALIGYSFAHPQMTGQACMTLCQSRGFTLAGTEWSQECFCGNSVEAGAADAPAADCNMACAGDANEVCGGGSRLNFYSYNATAATGASLPKDWVVNGCWAGQASAGRALGGPLFTDPAMTNKMCMDKCQAEGYPLAGVEYGQECRCAREFAAGSTQADAASCFMPCAGTPFEICGGPNRVTTFKYTGALAPPVVPSGPNNTHVAVAGWANRGCYTEGSAGRAFGDYSFARGDMTIPVCLAECGARGFAYGGVEYSQECFCGNAPSAGAVSINDGSCNMVCAGDATTLCGGPNRLNVFQSTAAVAATPQVWNYRGCFTETVASRAVKGGYSTSDKMDSEVCQAYAKTQGHSWAALVYGRECFTGTSLTPESTITSEGECNMVCVGSTTGEECGGINRASVFQLGGPVAPPRPAPTTAAPETTSTTAAASSTSPVVEAATTPAASSNTTVAAAEPSPAAASSTSPGAPAAAGNTTTPAAPVAEESSAPVAASQSPAPAPSPAAPAAESSPSPAPVAGSSSNSTAPVAEPVPSAEASSSSSSAVVAAAPSAEASSASSEAPASTPAPVRRGLFGRRVAAMF